MTADFLLYGSNGYTGDLLVREALARGVRPLLAGRNAAAVKAQAAEFGLDWRAFALDDSSALDAALAETPVVLHCAGPYQRTYAPMVEACLRTGTHYIDLAGEFSVFEGLLAHSEAAKARGVMILPAAGFVAAPTDCLAVHLKQRLPSATHLTIGFHGRGSSRVARGTALGSLEVLPGGARVRRDGQLEAVSMGSKSRQIDFGQGPITATRIIWGDVFLAYHSTGIPNIEDYIVLPAVARLFLPVVRPLFSLLRLRLVRALAAGIVRAGPPGPTGEERARTRMTIWGEVTDDAGGRAVSRMRGPESYAWTPLVALSILQRVLAGMAPPGFQTPARAFGPDFVLENPGVTREDVA